MMNLELLQKCNARQELARRHLLDFVTYTKPDYNVNWHHELLCKYLDKFSIGEIKRLMVFMPPQHGKSQLVSRHLPAYLLGLNPDCKIIGVSYSADLSTSFNRAVQRIIDTTEFGEVFPSTSMNGMGGRNGYLRNADIIEMVGYGGSFKSVGVGGSLTGNPADIAIIDDPVKDAAEANSATVQHRIWDWYNDVLLTRLHNNSRLLLTMTRWNENDLAGKILQKENKEDWHIILLPAIKEDDSNPEDPREIGEALWEQKHSKEKILTVRNQSKRTYLALYQQKPRQVSSGGEFFYNFSYGIHVKKVLFIPDRPIHLTFDFNSKPYMTLVLLQLIKKEIGYQIRIFKEYCFKHPKNNSYALCAQFKSDYEQRRPDIFYYGDAQGERRIEGRGDEKRFDDVRDSLKNMFNYSSKRTKNYNVSVIKRKDLMNDLLAGKGNNEIIIDEKCIETIADFENLLENKDGEKWKQEVSDPDNPQIRYQRHGHTSDSIEYCLSYIFEDEIKKQKD